MKRRLILAATAAALSSSPAPAATLGEAVKADMPSLMAIYRDFHANPELSFMETKTAARIAAELRKLYNDSLIERKPRKKDGEAKPRASRPAKTPDAPKPEDKPVEQVAPAERLRSNFINGIKHLQVRAVV